jgi:hypothetical protein
MNIENIIWQCLERAVERFNKSGDPQSLLCPRCENGKTPSEKAAASERAIAYRLAFYLESELRSLGLVSDVGSLVVDCEYNRHGGALKALAVEEKLKSIVMAVRRKLLDEPDEDGFHDFFVAPDIVVHQRRTDANNLLVVEIKKRSNRKLKEYKYDFLKLKLFTESKHEEKGYGYKFGALVVAEDDEDMRDLAIRKLRIWKQYKDGTKTRFIACEC